MEKEICIERENAMNKFIRKEGQYKEGMKEIRTGKGNLYRKNEIKKYIRKEGQKERKQTHGQGMEK